MAIARYSGWEGLPGGDAPEGVTAGCAVLEGGAFRGVYGEGVLDAMLQEGLNLQSAVGCSAGALNGMNYMAGQIGRSARINLGYRHDPRYVGRGPALREGSLISFDFLFRQSEDFDPFNYVRFSDPRRRFAVTVANCETGRAEFPEKGVCGDLLRAVQASASMPFVSRKVDVDGHPCLDGGCCCKIPYVWGLDQGFDRIVVVRTRHRAYRKPPISDRQRRLVDRFYGREYPAFAESLANSDADYNRQAEELLELERQGRVLMLAPSVQMNVGRLEPDMQKLGHLYWLGYYDTRARMRELKDYLGV